MDFLALNPHLEASGALHPWELYFKNNQKSAWEQIFGGLQANSNWKWIPLCYLSFIFPAIKMALLLEWSIKPGTSFSP